MNETRNSENELVLDILAAHVGTDEKERIDVATITRFARSEVYIFGKANVRGHITGSALILDHQNRTLLTFHRKLKRWLQLGGHSNPHETNPAQTALREAQEESGLTDLVFDPVLGAIPIDIDVHTIPPRKAEAEHLHLDFRYLLRTEKPEQVICSDESDALRWVPLEKLDEYDFDPALKRAMGKVRLINS